MDLHTAPAFYTGTSNITLPVANKAAFPEAFKDASRLTYYASLFSSLEVNSSFYKIPQPKTVARWVQEVPEAFRFTFKLTRDLTHSKSAVPDAELVTRFMQTINVAREKAGCLLVQFPGSQSHNPGFLERLLSLIRKDNAGWNICVEFRNTSWYRESIYQLLGSYDAAMVFHDMPKSATPPDELRTDFAYFRFHGPKGDYKGSYEFDVLEQQTNRMKTLLQAGKTVYTYFNNTAGSAVFDALAVQELVTGRNTFEP